MIPDLDPNMDEATLKRGRILFLFLMVTSMVALILGMQATWSCSFAERQVQPYEEYSIEEMCQDAYENVDLPYTNVDLRLCLTFFESSGVGFHHWQVTTTLDQKHVCLSYEMIVPFLGWVQPEFDNAFKSAYVLSVLAFIFCAFGWFTIAMSTCCPVSQARIKGLSIYFFFACLCQGLSFLMFASDICEPGFFQQYFPLVDLEKYIEEVHCKLGEGGRMSLAATFFYFVCMVWAPSAIAVPPLGYKDEWERDGPIRTEAPVVVPSAAAARESARGGKPIKIIIAGAPASGKGTQCEIIKEEFGVVHLSTGDMLRAAVAAGTKVGLEAKEYMDSGKLVPDEVIIGVVTDRIGQDDCKQKGWLLDGFPRTRAQAKALEEAGIEADVFLFLNVPDEVLVERVVGRRTDPETGKIYHLIFSPPFVPEVAARLEQRTDDTEEKVKVRIEQFHANVDAVKDSYADISVVIDGNRAPTLVSQNVVDAIQSKLSLV